MSVENLGLGPKLAWACYSVLLAIVMGLGGGAAHTMLDHHGRIAALEQNQNGIERQLRSIDRRLERIADHMEKHP